MNLIILAQGPTRIQCPFDAETWGLNNGYRQVREQKGHLDKLFLAHTQVKVKNDKGELENRFDWDEMNNLGVEIINTHKVKGLNSKIYPMKRITKKLGCDYYSDTICYMVAYAIDRMTRIKDGRLLLKEPSHIRIYGADMLTEDEYEKERGGIEYWIGFARGLGIKVDIARGSALCRNFNGKPYGTRCKDYSTLWNDYINGFLSVNKVGVHTGIIEYKDGELVFA